MAPASICMLLVLSTGNFLPLSHTFQSTVECEATGKEMTDGRTVKNFICLPSVMVDGLPVFACSPPPDPPIPKHQKRME